MCEDFGIGESDDEYYGGINRIIGSYDHYKENVKKFVADHDLEDNNRKLLEDLRKELA